MLPEELDDEEGEPGDGIATQSQVEEAAEGAQRDKGLARRLNRAAYVLLQTTTTLKATCSPEDLVQEALLALLSGRRRWRTNKVDFPGLLIGAMKSLAWSRDQTMTSTQPNLVMEGELEKLDPADQPLERLAVDPASPLVALEEAEKRADEDGALAVLRARFAPDDLVGRILDQMRKRQGYSHAEIREALGVGDRDYWNACKVLARAVDNFYNRAKDD